jgi:hypothetical protein
MICSGCQNRWVPRTLLPLQLVCIDCKGTGEVSDEQGNCVERAFNTGLRAQGIKTFQPFPKPCLTDIVIEVSKYWGLKVLGANGPGTMELTQLGNAQVLVVYKGTNPYIGGDYHAVFASDIAPFLGKTISQVVYGWEGLLTKEPYVL